MKRRTVTFTDNPPEVIDNDKVCYITAPLSSGHILLWLQRTKTEGRRRSYTTETESQWQNNYFRSLPDLNKDQHYLSYTDFNTDSVKNVFQQRQRLHSISLSVSDLGMAGRPRIFLREAFRSMRRITKMDASRDLEDVSRKGSEQLRQRHYQSLFNYFLNRHRRTATVNIATELSTKETLDVDTNSCAKNSAVHENGDYTDSDVFNKGIFQQYGVSANEDTDFNKNDIVSGSDDSLTCFNHTDEKKYKNYGKICFHNVDNDIANIVKRSEKISERNNDCGKLAKWLSQRCACYHLIEHTKSDLITEIKRKKSWKITDDGNSVGHRYYSSLDKLLLQDSQQRKRSANARNKSFVFNSTTNSVRNIRSMMYLKTKQQLMGEMAKHIVDCLEQFNTGLDKVLQARQLLETSQELPADDRETMLRLLNQAMQASLKRMESSEYRYDTDRPHSGSPNSFPGQRSCASTQQPSGTDDSNVNFHNVANGVDPAEFLQQHGQQLLALLQQNMAKQN